MLFVQGYAPRAYNLFGQSCEDARQDCEVCPLCFCSYAFSYPSSRKWFDIVSGYKEKGTPPDSNLSLEELRKQGYALTEQQWLQVTSMSRYLCHL